jgi:hypothetical protein
VRRRLAEVAPRVPVVFLTGYAYQPQSGDTGIQKPVTQASLVTSLREVLSQLGPPIPFNTASCTEGGIWPGALRRYPS